MGLTIVQKSDLSTRKRTGRIALVLAGGAVTGGAYKLGGLKALDDFLVNRKTTDFDIYVGLSAGAFLAAPLAGGVTPPEMLRSLDGSSDEFTYLSPLDFYSLNLAEFVSKPLEFIVDLLTYFPDLFGDFVRRTPDLFRSLRDPVDRARKVTVLARQEGRHDAVLGRRMHHLRCQQRPRQVIAENGDDEADADEDPTPRPDEGF